MKAIQLLKAIGAADDDLLGAYEQNTGKSKKAVSIKWLRWGAAAACLCIILLAVFKLPQWGGSELVSDETTSGLGGITIPSSIPPSTASEPEQKEPQQEPQSVHYNTATGLTDAAPRLALMLFSEPLDEAGLQIAAPAVRLEWMKPSGFALFYGWGGLAMVSLDFTNNTWGGTVSVCIQQGEQTLLPTVIMEGEPVATSIQGDEFFVYSYEFGTNILLAASLSRDGINHWFSVETRSAQLALAESALYDVMSCYAKTESAPDLNAIKAKHSESWRNETITMQEALLDPAFGKYLPEEIPAGFAEESFRRFCGNEQNYLSGLWTSGYDSLHWRISYLDDHSRARLTAVADTENYDLALYPIPLADSVPSALREVVDNPVFRIDELTQDAVNARAYTVGEVGDSDGYRMRFSVLYGDVVVEITAKGLAPAWVFEQLRRLAD